MCASVLPYVKVAAPKRKRLSDTICEQIEGLIAGGTLAPGHRLPAERELAEHFGVSRPSLREALLRLEARGLLRVARHGGFAVTEVSAPAVTDPLAHLLQAHPKAARDLLELYHGLEGLAAQHAATRATDRDRARLRRCLERWSDPQRPRDATSEARLDAEFHQAIAEASHNLALMHVMHGLHRLLQTAMPEAWERIRESPARSARLQAQHRAMLDAVLEGNAARVRDAARRHLAFVRDLVAPADDAARSAAPAAPEAQAQVPSRKA